MSCTASSTEAHIILASRKGACSVVRSNCYTLVPQNFSDIFTVNNQIQNAKKEIWQISTILLTKDFPPPVPWNLIDWLPSVLISWHFASCNFFYFYISISLFHPRHPSFEMLDLWDPKIIYLCQNILTDDLTGFAGTMPIALEILFLRPYFLHSEDLWSPLSCSVMCNICLEQKGGLNILSFIWALCYYKAATVKIIL